MPSASISFLALESDGPRAAILPSAIPMSQRIVSDAVTTVPLEMTRSNAFMEGTRRTSQLRRFCEQGRAILPEWVARAYDARVGTVGVQHKMSTAKTSAIHGTWVLAFEHNEPRLLADRWVVTEGNTISAISRAGHRRPTWSSTGPACSCCRGLINMHNHCFSELLVRGRTEDLDGRSYVTTLIYGLLMPLQQLAIENLCRADLREYRARGCCRSSKADRRH